MNCISKKKIIDYNSDNSEKMSEFSSDSEDSVLKEAEEVMEEDERRSTSINEEITESSEGCDEQSGLQTPVGNFRSPMERFLNDISNCSNEEVGNIAESSFSQKRPTLLCRPRFQTTLNFRSTKSINGPDKNKEASVSDRSRTVERIYVHQKSKVQHKRLHYDEISLKNLFKHFESYIKYNKLPTKRKIQKYIFVSGSEILKEAGVEKVYYVLKNKIRSTPREPDVSLL